MINFAFLFFTGSLLYIPSTFVALIIKATKVNGIYNKDPIKHKNAKLIKNISYNDVINKNLQVMDITAISLAKDTKIPIFITNIFNKNSLINVLNRKGSYSKIS